MKDYSIIEIKLPYPDQLVSALPHALLHPDDSPSGTWVIKSIHNDVYVMDRTNQGLDHDVHFLMRRIFSDHPTLLPYRRLSLANGLTELVDPHPYVCRIFTLSHDDRPLLLMASCIEDIEEYLRNPHNTIEDY